MIKDFLISFKDNLNEKTRNPFLGTYLVVWVIRNWILLYTLFNFDINHNLKFRIEYIQSYYSENDFLFNLLTNVLWAFAVLIATYILLNISRLIINVSEKKISPWVYKISDSNSIVLKESYDILFNEKMSLENKLDKERENRAKLQSEILNLEDKLEQNYIKTSNHKIQNKKIDNNPVSNSSSDLLLNKIKKKDYSNNFIDTVLFLKRENGWMLDSETEEYVDYFSKIGLLTIDETRNGYTRFSLTNEGKDVLKMIRLEIE